MLSRIHDLTNVGRAGWLGLLAYLAFVTITLLGVDHADFFIDARETTLPLVGVSIPTFSFFIFAPVLGTALYVYLHLTVRKLADALCASPSHINGKPFEEEIKPWLLNDFILRQRGDGATRNRRLDGLAAAITLLLVWLAGPIVLAMFWTRSWPAHAELLSLGLLICFFIATHTGIMSWAVMKEAVRTKGAPPKQQGKATWERAYIIAMVVAFAATGFFSLVKTEIGDVRNLGPNAEIGGFWTHLSPINLNGLIAATLPPDQLDYDAAMQTYRIGWCDRAQYHMAVCGHYIHWRGDISTAQTVARAAWCNNNRADVREYCDTHFARLDREFLANWRAYRAAQIAALTPPDLSNADLRNADLVGAQLVGVDLSRARLDGANLDQAQMQGADLDNADLIGAILPDADLQGADLGLVQMDDRTILADANLHGAALRLVDTATLEHLLPFWQDMFADGSVRGAYETLRARNPALPDWPPVDHWALEPLDYNPFDTRNSEFHTP